jgi:hypothetical protein
MKKRKVAGITSLAIVFFLFLIGCEQQMMGSLSSDARITGVAINEVRALSLGTPSADWAKAVEQPGHIYLSGADFENAMVSAEKAEEGTKVFFAQARPNVMPEFVEENVFTFESDNYLFVEAFSANLDAYQIYAIQIHRKTPNLSDVTLGGRSAVGGTSPAGQPILQFGGGLGTPAAAWEDITETGEIWYGDAQEGDSLDITVTPEVPFTTIRIASATPEGAPVFRGAFFGAGDGGVISGLQVSAVNDSYLYIEARGDDANFTEMAYYKIKMVSKKSNRALKSAKFVWYDGNTKLGEQAVGIGVMGTDSFSGSEAYGNYSNGAEIVGGSGSSQTVPLDSTSIVTLYPDSGNMRPPANFRIALELEGEDPGTTFAYDITKNQRSVLEFTNTTGDFGNLLGFWWIGVEVASEIGEKGWYKFATRIGSEKAELGSVKINDVALETLPGANSAATDLTGGFVTVSLPRDQLSAIKVEAAPPAGYQSNVSMVFAPDAATNVPQVTFNINGDSNYSRETGKNTTTFSVEPGTFVYIRVLAEISWYYGGSGFVGATWNPARAASGGNPGYSAYKYYKIRFIPQAEDNSAALTSISYKGGPIASIPDPVTVTTSSSVSYSSDSKGNVIANAATTTTWGQEAAEHVTVDYDNVTIQAVPGNPGAKVAYAVATSNVTAPVAAANFTESGNLENLVPNSYVVIRVTPADGSDPSYYKIRVHNNGNSDYALTAITINGTDVGTVGSGNTAANGTTVITHSMAKAGFARVTVAASAPQGAVVAYAAAAANNTAPAADAYNTDGIFPDFGVAQWVVIRVISEDYTQTRYYKVRLQASDANAGAGLGEIKINGVSIGTVPNANTAANGQTAALYHVPSAAGLTNMRVEVTPADGSAGAAVAYAAGAAANTAPAADAYNTDGAFASFANAQWLVIRVISEDGLTTQYYKVRVASGSDLADITGIAINGTGIATVPEANAAANGTSAVDYVVPNASVLADLTVGVTASPGASVDFNVTTAVNTGPTTWPVTDGKWKNFAKGSWVVIRVIAEDTIKIQYYKVRLTYGGTDAGLSAIRINNTSIGTVPEANTAANGGTAATYRVANAAALNTVNVAVDAPAGASIAYASAASATTNITSWTNTTGVFTSFTRNNYVAIRVISEDTTVTRYYKVRLIYGNQSTELGGITINGNSIGAVPAANNAGNGTTAANYTTPNYLNPVTVGVTGAPSGSVVEYASAAAANTNPSAWSAGGILGLVSGQYVVIRVTPEDTTIPAVYYKVRVIHGSDEADLYSIKINDDFVVPTPAANENVTGNIAGTINLPAAAFTSLRVRVGIDPGASAAYAAAASSTANITNWSNTTGNFTGFTDGQYLVIRVVSQNGQSTKYYKVQLNQQP